MAKKRQQTPTGDPSVRSLELVYSQGTTIDAHEHRWAQLIYASDGLLQVVAGRSSWLVPPTRAVWAPAGVTHELRTLARTRLRTLYLRSRIARRIGARARVLSVEPLLRELVLHTVALGVLDDADPEQRRLRAVLVDRIARSAEAPLRLDWPSDARAARAAQRVVERPGEGASAAEIARGASMSLRTMERVFSAETGLSFGRWRRQARLMEAARLLGEGADVASAARASGYRSVSTFIGAFRDLFGVTPGDYGRAS